MVSAEMDLDAQYSQDIEQAIAMSKESAKEEMEGSQAIAESEALVAENRAADPDLGHVIMTRSDNDVEILENLPTKKPTKGQMDVCQAIEESHAPAAGNSRAEPEYTDVERERVEKEAAMTTPRATVSNGSSSPTLRPRRRAQGSTGYPLPDDERSLTPEYVTIGPHDPRRMGFLPDAPTTPTQMNALPRPFAIPSPSPAPMLADPDEEPRLQELAEANHYIHEPTHPFREKPSRRNDYHPPMYIRDDNNLLYVDLCEDDEVTGRRVYTVAEYGRDKRRLPGEDGYVSTNNADNRLQGERRKMDEEEAQGRGSEAVKEARECAMQ